MIAVNFHHCTDLLALRIWVEDPEVGHWIDPSTRTPLPPAVVRGKIAVDERLHEVLRKHNETSSRSKSSSAHLLTQPPIDHQVFDQVHRRDHPDTVMHPAHLVCLAHACVDNRHTRPAVLPCLEVFFVLLPIDIRELLKEGPPHRDARIHRQNVRIEVPPGELLDPAANASLAACINLLCAGEFQRSADASSGRYDTRCEVRASSTAQHAITSSENGVTSGGWLYRRRRDLLRLYICLPDSPSSGSLLALAPQVPAG